MDSLVFEILKVITMLLVAVVVRYLIPWLKLQIGESQLKEITHWVDTAVLMAQQVHSAKTGAERKAIVIDLLRKMLTSKNITIDDEQLDALIEAAVKTMKMKEEKSTVTINSAAPTSNNEATDEV